MSFFVNVTTTAKNVVTLVLMKKKNTSLGESRVMFACERRHIVLYSSDCFGFPPLGGGDCGSAYDTFYLMIGGAGLSVNRLSFMPR
jgi:hypothetical protein